MANKDGQKDKEVTKEAVSDDLYFDDLNRVIPNKGCFQFIYTHWNIVDPILTINIGGGAEIFDIEIEVYTRKQ